MYTCILIATKLFRLYILYVSNYYVSTDAFSGGFLGDLWQPLENEHTFPVVMHAGLH